MDRVKNLCLNLLGFCVIALMVAIVAQVVCNAMDINPVVVFDRSLPWVGKAITLNSLLDLQWHLLLIIGLLPAGLVWAMDRHVRVDFLYQHLHRPGRTMVDMVGHALFAAPFLILVLPASWAFLGRAWRSDEASRNGGLNDLWMIKAVLPFGLALLALAVLWEAWRLLRAMR
ncbi:MAG: TRAP transporter small permease subunit [Pseudomonadota bacterium]